MGLDGNYEEQTRKELPKIMKPGEIYRRLNEYVIGQDEAKKSLSVAVYNHYKEWYMRNQTQILKFRKVIY